LSRKSIAAIAAPTWSGWARGYAPGMRTSRPTSLQEAERLRLFHSGEHPCGYWPQRTARDLVLDPRDPRLPELYPMALDWGFRRSGDLLYRPHCRGCRA